MIKKRLLACFLSAALIISAIPTAVFADPANADGVATVSALSEETETVTDTASQDDSTAPADVITENKTVDEEVDAPAADTETNIDADSNVTNPDASDEIIEDAEGTDKDETADSDATEEDEEIEESSETEEVTEDPDDATSQINTTNSFEYKILADGTLEILSVKLDDKTTYVAIPPTIDGYPVSTIGFKALYRSAVSEIYIPATVTTLKQNAFSYNFDLRHVVFGEGSQLKTIGTQAFYNCSSLWGIDLPNGLEKIESNAFANCTRLNEIIIPDSVTSIGSYAYAGCEGIRSIHFSSGLTTLPASGNLKNLQYIYIPKSVTSIASSWLDTTTMVCYEGTEAEFKSIYSQAIPEKVTMYYERKTPLFKFTLLADGTYEVSEYLGSGDTVLRIPNKYNGKKVSTIGEKLFYWTAPDVKEVYIKEGIEVIKPYAFSANAGIELVRLPTTLKRIEYDAFNGCANLKYIELPYGLEHIGMRAFCNCPYLTSIIVPDSVVYVGNYCFGSMDGLKCVTFGTGMKTLQSNTLYNLPALEKVIFSEEVTRINNDFIYGCNDNLKIVYRGTKDDYKQIDIKTPNDNLLNSTWSYDDGYGAIVIADLNNLRAVMNCSQIFTIYAINVKAYQWQYSKDGGQTWHNSTSSTAKSSDLNVTCNSNTKNSLYRCRITGLDGKYAYSNAAGFDVVPGAVITLQPHSQVVKMGESASFKVTARNVEEDSYQWFYSKDGSSWFKSTLASAKTDTLTVKTSTTNINYQYRCQMTGTDGNIKKSTPVGFIQVSTRPADSTAKVGSKVTFKTVASKSDTTYQWQYSKDGKEWYNTSLSGNATSTLSFTASTNNRSNYFRCKLTDARGFYGFTNEVSLVNEPKNPYIITEGMTSAGDYGSFYTNYSVLAANVASYQWQYSDNEGKTWTNSTNVNAKSCLMSIAYNSKYENRLYRCKLTGLNGTVIYSSVFMPF